MNWLSTSHKFTGVLFEFNLTRRGPGRFTKVDRIAAQLATLIQICSFRSARYRIDYWSYITKMACLIVGKNQNLRSLSKLPELTIGMWCAHPKPWRSVSLIFKDPIKFPMHRIKHECFIHRHETAHKEGFLHLLKDTCATAIGQPSRLWVLLFYCCASDWFKTC